MKVMQRLASLSTAPLVGLGASAASPIIIATDGRTQSDGALMLGGTLAEDASAVRVATVLKPMPVMAESQLSITLEIEDARRADLRFNVQEQVARAWSDVVDVEVFDGDLAMVATRLARETNARMIVCGIGRHLIHDRLFGDETALRLMRSADVPVLAAAAAATGAPECIIVAMDFSSGSRRAARLALAMAAPRASIHLVHVMSRESASAELKGWGVTAAEQTNAALRSICEQLRVPPEIDVEPVLLTGDPATELLAYASSLRADLIAVGTHGHGFITRMLLGSVTTRVVRGANCSVLSARIRLEACGGV